MIKIQLTEHEQLS